jgi:superfamily II DNA or RNA helicase
MDAPIFQERPYQIEALSAIRRGFNEGVDAQVLVVPTGGGKTIIFSNLTKIAVRKGHKVLILAHREELLQQAQDKLWNSQGIQSSFERAESRASLDAQVVIASVQSLCRPERLARFPQDHFHLIIIDEAHRSLAQSYMKIIQHFHRGTIQVLDEDENAKAGDLIDYKCPGTAYLLGVTATPDRGDKRALSAVYDKIAYEVRIRTLIADGYLSQIRCLSFPIKGNLKAVKSTAGDYDVNGLAEQLGPILDELADQFVAKVQEYNRTKCLVFLPLVALSEAFAEKVEQRGIVAEHIDGKSSDRKEILERFRSGKTRVLCNAMLLTEGYDEPGIDCVMVLRPTKIRALYCQMIGRGTRICEGKDHLLIIDPLWLGTSHQLCTPASLVAETDQVKSLMDEKLKEHPDSLGEEDYLDMDLMHMERDAEEERLEKLRREVEANRRKKTKTYDPVEMGSALGESAIADYEPTMAWEAGPVTINQKRALENFGVDAESMNCAGQASAILDRIMVRAEKGLATPKQLLHLKRMRVRDADTLTIQQASAELGRAWGGNYSKKKLKF